MMKTKEEQNKQLQKHRLFKKILHIITTYKCSFLTMSFSDKKLKNTDEKTRERYIKTYLKNETALYIANKDYGSKKGREHYHAIIIASTLTNEDFKPNQNDLLLLKNQINLKAYKYGDINAQFIRTTHFKYKMTSTETAEKLTEHFFKESTKGSRIITSRKEPTKESQIKRLERLQKTKEENKPKNTYKRMTQQEILESARSDFDKAINPFKENKYKKLEDLFKIEA